MEKLEISRLVLYIIYRKDNEKKLEKGAGYKGADKECQINWENLQEICLML